MANGIAGDGARHPLSRWQVLEEENAVLNGAHSARAQSVWLFGEDDIVKDAKTERALLEEVRQNPQDPLSQTLADEWNKTRDLVTALNTLVRDPQLYSEQRFPPEKLTEEAREAVRMIECKPQGDDLIYWNRILLESMYPEALRKIEECVVKRLHAQNRTALCFSGGGIRSATFNLGVLQGLAAYDLLDKFDYLSTVSGGGYIGSWLSAWIFHEGRASVVKELKYPRQSKIDPEYAPIRHLREYSNYLTPEWGLLSADTWTWVAIYLRNLLLNWLVLVSLFAAALLVPRLAVAVVQTQPDKYWGAVCFLLGFLLTIKAIDYISMNLPSVADSPKDQNSFLRWCWVPLIVAAILLTTFWAWLRNSGAALDEQLTYFSRTLIGVKGWQWAIFVVFGVLVHLAGWCRSIWLFSRKDWIRDFLYIIGAGAFGGWLVWLIATKISIFIHPAEYARYYVCFAAPLLLLLFLGATTLYVGWASHITSDADREWWARSGGWALIALVSWSGVSWLVLFGPSLFLSLSSKLQAAVGGLGGVAGIFTLLIGHSPSTAATKTESDGNAHWATMLKDNALLLAAPLFAAFLIVLLSLGTSWFIKEMADAEWMKAGYIPEIFRLREWSPGSFDVEGLYFFPEGFSFSHLWVVYRSTFALLFVLTLVLLVIGVWMGLCINVNKFSLHSAYRDRLTRAYLGASRKKRNPNLFTGFDPNDNVQMYELVQKPLHVINMTLNLVHGEKLGWQERKAESFTVSSLHTGNYRLGYRRSDKYGGQRDIDGKTEGISLGTALAISGAAVSPNWGYHSSPVVTFLLALFNVRLGWWLGNPGVAGNQVFRRRGPRFAVGPLLKETFGLTTDTNPYVYLSDGGHFENLALYEMVLRRCHCIVVVDAGCDPGCMLDDLGGAIRKIRTDLGIPISFAEEEFPIYPRIDAEGKNEKRIGRRFIIGTIKYSKVDQDATDGLLIYLKPTFYGNEPLDIVNYAKTSPTFPHETTADQWFSESQFESYRGLGLYTVEEVIKSIQSM